MKEILKVCIIFVMRYPIEKALDLAISKGAKLKTCLAWGQRKHPHPEGFVAFLEDQIIGRKLSSCRCTPQRN